MFRLYNMQFSSLCTAHFQWPRMVTKPIISFRNLKQAAESIEWSFHVFQWTDASCCTVLYKGKHEKCPFPGFVQTMQKQTFSCLSLFTEYSGNLVPDEWEWNRLIKSYKKLNVISEWDLLGWLNKFLHFSQNIINFFHIFGRIISIIS